MILSSDGINIDDATIVDFCFPEEPEPADEQFPVPGYTANVVKEGYYCFFEPTEDITRKEYIYPSDHKPVTARLSM